MFSKFVLIQHNARGKQGEPKWVLVRNIWNGFFKSYLKPHVNLKHTHQTWKFQQTDKHTLTAAEKRTFCCALYEHTGKQQLGMIPINKQVKRC